MITLFFNVAFFLQSDDIDLVASLVAKKKSFDYNHILENGFDDFLR